VRYHSTVCAGPGKWAHIFYTDDKKHLKKDGTPYIATSLNWKRMPVVERLVASVRIPGVPPYRYSIAKLRIDNPVQKKV
jgi:hypothetical protein